MFSTSCCKMEAQLPNYESCDMILMLVIFESLISGHLWKKMNIP